MFAILQVSETNTFLRKPKIKSQRFNLPSGDAFFIVTSDKHLGKIPWKKLEKCLGILRHCILLPDDITIPNGITITAFTPKTLPKLLLMNSATDYIIKHKQIFRSKNLTIFDKDGIYNEYIEKLLPCLKNIRIITDKREMYEALSEKFITDYGFSLIISDKESFDCDIVISQECSVSAYFSGTVFSGEKKYIMNADVFSGTEIELPAEYENIRPANIDRIFFSSALYEKSGEKILGKLRYTDFSS